MPHGVIAEVYLLAGALPGPPWPGTFWPGTDSSSPKLSERGHAIPSGTC
jgi:hypothetical protein